MAYTEQEALEQNIDGYADKLKEYNESIRRCNITKAYKDLKVILTNGNAKDDTAGVNAFYAKMSELDATDEANGFISNTSLVTSFEGGTRVDLTKLGKETIDNMSCNKLPKPNLPDFPPDKPEPEPEPEPEPKPIIRKSMNSILDEAHDLDGIMTNKTAALIHNTPIQRKMGQEPLPGAVQSAQYGLGWDFQKTDGSGPWATFNHLALQNTLTQVIKEKVQPKVKMGFLLNVPGKDHPINKLDLYVRAVDRPKIDFEIVTQVRNGTNRNLPVKFSHGDLTISFWDDNSNTSILTLQDCYIRGTMTTSADAGVDSSSHKLYTKTMTEVALRDDVLIPQLDLYELSYNGYKHMKYSYYNVILTNFDFDQHDDADDSSVYNISVTFKTEYVEAQLVTAEDVRNVFHCHFPALRTEKNTNGLFWDTKTNESGNTGLKMNTTSQSDGFAGAITSAIQKPDTLSKLLGLS